MGKKQDLNFRERRIVTNFGTGNKPEAIVIHETDNTAPSAGALNHSIYFNTPGVRVSCHYVVDDLDIIKLLDHGEAAWHSGRSSGAFHNRNTIGIEICVNGVYFPAWYRAALLTGILMEETGIERVIRHKDVSGKHCPRRMIDEPNLWQQFLENCVRSRGLWQLHEVYRHYDPHKDPRAPIPRVGIVKAERRLNVRSGRGTQHPILGRLNRGEPVTLLWLLDGWWSIDYGHGVGYVSRRYIEEIRLL